MGAKCCGSGQKIFELGPFCSFSRGSCYRPMAALVLALLGACQTTGSGVITERTPTERGAIGALIEERLLKIRPQQPIFAVRRTLMPSEQSVLMDFVATLPSGRLIEGGNPIYWLDVSSKMNTELANLTRLTYEVAIRRADNSTLVSRRKEASICIDSEALYTYPIRCSLLRPMLLRLALEGL